MIPGAHDSSEQVAPACAVASCDPTPVARIVMVNTAALGRDLMLDGIAALQRFRHP